MLVVFVMGNRHSKLTSEYLIELDFLKWMASSKGWFLPIRATTFKFSDILTGYSRILYFSYANISDSSPRNNSLVREACSLSISRQDTWVPEGI